MSVAAVLAIPPRAAAVGGSIWCTLNGISVLECIVTKLQRMDPSLADLFIWPSDSDGLFQLENWAESVGHKVVYSAHKKGFSPLLRALEYSDADSVLRLGAICPIIDLSLIKSAYRQFKNECCDYLAADESAGLPAGFGFDLISSDALRSIATQAHLADITASNIVPLASAFTPHLLNVAIDMAIPENWHRYDLRVITQADADRVSMFTDAHSTDTIADIVFALDPVPDTNP